VFAFDWRSLLVTVLVAVVAIGLVLAQFSYADNPNNQQSLSNLSQRVPMLEQTTNWIQRDQLCMPLAAYGRALAAALPANSRVYLTGMVGPTNQGSLGYYYFLRNYLFPRDLEIYLGQGSFTRNGFTGQPADSPEMLKTNGFDLVVVFENNQMQLLPLTTNGVPKPQ
jgi:hypothetical protein